MQSSLVTLFGHTVYSDQYSENMTAKLWSLQEHLSLLTPKVGEMPAVRSFDKFSLRQPFPKPKRRRIWELSSAVFTVPSSAPA
jgi:hypothetical protein